MKKKIMRMVDLVDLNLPRRKRRSKGEEGSNGVDSEVEGGGKRGVDRESKTTSLATRVRVV